MPSPTLHDLIMNIPTISADLTIHELPSFTKMIHIKKLVLRKETPIAIEANQPPPMNRLLEEQPIPTSTTPNLNRLKDNLKMKRFFFLSEFQYF